MADATKKIGFRTDVRMFMALLVGFLIVLILVLLTILQNFHLTTAATIARERDESADTIAESISNASEGDMLTRLSLLRARHDVAAIVLRGRGGATITSGDIPPPPTDVLRRNTRAGEVVLHFDDSEVQGMRRTFLITAAICFVSSLVATGLLLLYLSRITRPIDAMLDHARELGERGDVEETQYLVETFRSSIATLKAQEAELRRLHEAEKTRADDLARVTATLTRSLTSGFLALDEQGLVVDANRAALEILGVDALNRRPLREAIGESPFTDVVERAFAQRGIISRQEVGYRASVIGLTAVPLRNEHDRFLGMLVLFTDLTPTHALEQRVRDLQNLADLGEISAGIAHEFRNSLSTILGYLKLARRQQPPPEVEARLRAAEDEALQLANAVAALLQFAKPVQLERHNADLLQLVRDVVGRAEALAPEVEFRVSGTPVEIPADAALLGRAIENLVRNAVESVRENGAHGLVTATVAAEPVPSITITDNGKGFNESEAARLFLPFQSGKATGFGLGLPIAKKIVLLHGGTISLRTNESGGATARIEFVA